MRRFCFRRLLCALLFAGLTIVTNPGLPSAEEGMWTFDNLPVKLWKEKYGFEPTQDWVDHLRLASVRFNDGGSGSFVSADGLVMTNHHVARGQLQKVSSAEHNYAEDGFLARSAAEEIKCPDLELNQLVSYQNVTARVHGVVKPGTADSDALAARRAEIARIEKESLDKTGLRSDVVMLYQGGEYWLYRYKRYTDIRVVFAPEQQIAFFGGDFDNFTYPRYDLDMAIFRVYENGRPVRPEHFLKWNARGAAEGDLVFVSGHPGSTNRLDTLAQLEYARDIQIPTLLAFFDGRLATLQRFAASGGEAARQAQDLTFGLENARKAYRGELGGLRDQAVIAKKTDEERDLRGVIQARPPLRKLYGDPWADIAAILGKAGETYKTRFYSAIERSQAQLPATALTLVQYVTEVVKPDAARLPGFHESQLESLRLSLLSPAPAYPELDAALLASWLEEGLKVLGPDNTYVKTVLRGRAPAEVAKSAVLGSKIGDPAVREALVKGGRAAVDRSTDPLIVLARALDPIAREQQKWVEANVDAPLEAASEKIGRARFAVYGKSVSPDATFTLRLSYGTVKGYPMNGTIAPPKTTLYGLYDRSFGFNQKAPYHLPARFLDRRSRLDMATPVNFVTTNDVVGGNSGSPVVNRDGEIVGLVFDGNIESLAGTYVYNIENNRTVAVHTAFITEALRKVYDAEAILTELGVSR